MSIVSSILIALSLSMDAFAVSVTYGMTMRTMSLRLALRVALLFGGFQAIMPVLGWLAGYSFRAYIEAVDHFIAFGLLAIIGGKMIWEAGLFREKKECAPDDKECAYERITVLLGLAVATSIDALAVGVTFVFLKISIVIPVIVIGVITFAMCMLGVRLGVKGNALPSDKIETAAGVILIGIGTKILIEHLCFA